jgi:predicted transcriptional regulator
MKRSRTEVIVEILNAAKNDACKTRLMYNVNMNLASFNKYLRELTKAGLVAKINNSQNKVTYKITERGKSLLELLEKAEEFISL